MIRRMLSLAVEAAKEEFRLRRETPAPVVVPAVEHVPAINEAVEVTLAPHWSETGDGHMRALKSPTCLDCDAPKKVGWYRCDDCRQRNSV